MPQQPDSSSSPTIVAVLMGVSGVGKTAVGTAAADRLGWDFFDGDDFHSEANVEKMRSGIPLTDDDRWDWLDTLVELIRSCQAEGRPAIIACSALKETYRERLLDGSEGVFIVYLSADSTVVADRIRARRGHYFDADLLDSQYAALEEPADAVTIDAAQSLDAVIDDVVAVLERAAAEASAP